jgi:hypothetical protein
MKGFAIRVGKIQEVNINMTFAGNIGATSVMKILHLFSRHLLMKRKRNKFYEVMKPVS